MKRLIPLALFLLSLTACGGSDDASPAPVAEYNKTPEEKDAAHAADDILRAIEARQYAEVFEAASPGFKAANGRDDFVGKMREVEVFGKLTGFEQRTAPVFADASGRRVATLDYTATYTFGTGPFSISLAPDASGVWRLDYYKYDIATTTTNPPYPSSESGADALAHRFMYLWQTRHYDELSETMRLETDEVRLKEFFGDLEKAGRLLAMKRTGYSAGSRGGGKSVKVDYTLTFDNGSGYITFQLLDDAGNWRILPESDAVKYDVEYIAK